MTAFDTREKEFEARFKHDQELQFKITARRNRLLGLWAAQHLGLLGDAAEAYAQRVVEADGGQHADNEADHRRTAWLEAEGWRVLRFWNNDVLANTDGVIETILRELSSN